MNIVQRLKNYKTLKAEIKSIELDIEELHDSEHIGSAAISYEEKSAPTNAFNSQTENEGIKLADTTNLLLSKKRAKEREIERIDNALSILNDKEREILELKYIKGYKWDTVTYKMDRSYSYCKDLENRALMRIRELFKN